MCDTIIRQMVSLQEAWYKNYQIDPRLNSMSSSELHWQLVALRNQLSFPEQLLWFLFKGYDPRLRQLQALVMNAEPADMKILFDALPGTPCGFSDSRLSGSDELNDNGLLNTKEAGLLTTYPATCGQYDDYLFVPNEITHSEILSIIGDEEEYEESRSSGFKTEASFCVYVDKTLQLLNRVPWLGYVESFPDLTYFVLLCKKEEQTIIESVAQQLQANGKAYRILKCDETFQMEEYGHWNNLPLCE